MSLLTEKEIDCPACRFPNNAEIWTVITVKTEPELRDLLLGGEINLVKCASCKEVFYANEFFLYHDQDRELMAFVYPPQQMGRKEELLKAAKQDFRESQVGVSIEEKLDYEPIVLFGMDALVGLAQNEEEAEIQGEIIDHLSKIHGFEVRRLKKSKAREMGFPPVIPVSSKKFPTLKESILDGISLVETFNDRLHIYRDVQKILLNSDELDIPILADKH